MRILFVLFILLPLSLARKSYSNYTLFRTLPSSEKHLEFVKNLSQLINVDYWRPPILVNKPVEMLINPKGKKYFMESMDEQQFAYTTVVEDVQRLIDMQTVKSYITGNMKSYDWTSYFTLKDIYAWYEDLAKHYPEVTILHLGKTYEQREILCLKVVMHGSENDTKEKRSAVVVEGGIHSWELISPAFVTYFLDQLLKSKDDTDLIKIAKKYEFYFIPVLNPDGYEYNMNQDRLWGKNRKGGYGVNIHYNFDFQFGQDFASFDNTSSEYCGPHPFSEKESQAIKNIVQTINGCNLEYYFSFHGTGKNIMIPFENPKDDAENQHDIYFILHQAMYKIRKRFGTEYKMSTFKEYYGSIISGSSTAWVKKAYKVPYALFFELRTHENKVVLSDYILPTSQELMDGIWHILSAGRGKSRKLRKLSLGSVAESNRQVKSVFDVFFLFFNIILLFL